MGHLCPGLLFAVPRRSQPLIVTCGTGGPESLLLRGPRAAQGRTGKQRHMCTPALVLLTFQMFLCRVPPGYGDTPLCTVLIMVAEERGDVPMRDGGGLGIGLTLLLSPALLGASQAHGPQCPRLGSDGNNPRPPTCSHEDKA